MKYRRKRMIKNYAKSVATSENKKGKKAKRIVYALFFLPLLVSLLTGSVSYKRIETAKGVEFLKALGKDVALYVSEKFPSVSKVGKTGAKFCFEYIRGEKKESIPVISTLDSKSTSLTSITDDADKAIEVKADVENTSNGEDPCIFSPVMPCKGEISSPFGKRVHPLSGEETSHNGIDIAIDSGTEVCAIEDGEVQKSEYNQFSGNYIVIAHKDGYTSSYAHLKETKVKTGDIVKKGDIIGISGSTGAVTGPHLHMEIRKDSSPIDPMTLIVNDD